MKYTTTDYEIVEEGEYPAVFSGYEERSTEFGDAVMFSFTLRDEEHSGSEIRGLASAKLTPKAKMRAWVEGIMGRALENKEEVDLDDLVGRKVMLYLSVADTEKGMFNRNEKIRVPRRKAKRAPVVEEEEEEEVPVKPARKKMNPATQEEGDPF